MPIVISRNSDQPVVVSPLSPEQREKAWEFILKKYLDQHPEVLRDVQMCEVSA